MKREKEKVVVEEKGSDGSGKTHNISAKKGVLKLKFKV